MAILLEICCGSADDAIAAARGGAQRVELCSDLYHGGLTPSVGALRTVKRHAPALRVMCIVRPREGGFCYSETEFECMLEDARALLEGGADGIVFGFLHEDGTVDIDRCHKMLEVIGKKESVFHRAIDVVPDVMATLEQLIALGVTRVLTSGQCPSVSEGSETIRAMIEHAAGRIEILPGGGVRPNNAQEILARTGASMLHASCRRMVYDRSAQSNPAVRFNASELPSEESFKRTDSDDVASFLAALA